VIVEVVELQLHIGARTGEVEIDIGTLVTSVDMIGIIFANHIPGC
jgi:hypothetical protein